MNFLALAPVLEIGPLCSILRHRLEVLAVGHYSPLGIQQTLVLIQRALPVLRADVITGWMHQ